MVRAGSCWQMVLMSKPFYPKIDLTTVAALRTLHQQFKLHDGYLENPDCPYDKDTAQTLAKIMSPEVVEVEKVVEKVVERKSKIAERAAEGGGVGPKKIKLKTSGVDQDGVSQEIQDLRKELQQLKIDSKGLQTSDKIQIIKTRAGLVEKLVAMDERIHNLKRHSLFQSTVMAILDDLIDEERRKEFLKRIQPFAVEETAS